MLTLFSIAPALIIGQGYHPAVSRCRHGTSWMALELTPTLIEWGVDEELWSETRDKQKLLDLASAGNEAKCRKRIEFLRAAITRGGGDGASPAPPRVQNHGPYSLVGTPPDGVDVATVEDILEVRADKKKVRDFAAADVLQAELMEMGVYVNDRKRTWEAAKAPNGGFSLKGEAPAGVDVAVVEGILLKRREAKKAKDFAAADAMQEELMAMNVWVDDKKRTWSSRADVKREPKAYSLNGSPPDGLDVSAVEAMLARRVAAKKTRDWATSDVLQAELLKMGVYVNDKTRTWEEASWVKAQKQSKVSTPAADPEATGAPLVADGAAPMAGPSVELPS